MKLNKKYGNGGHVTSYTVNIGSKEARDLGSLNEDGTSQPIKKTVDLENLRVVFELDKQAETMVDTACRVPEIEKQRSTKSKVEIDRP